MASEPKATGLEPQKTGSSFWLHAFESMVSELPEAAFVINEEGRITHWNDAVADRLGVPARDAVGTNAYEIFGTEGESETLAETVVRTGEPIREEEIERIASRQADDLDAMQSQVSDFSATVDEVAGRAADISDAINEIASANETQSEMVHDLEERIDSVDREISEIMDA